MYQALYRKWRPKTFDDVVGQEHITETLKKQVMTGHLSHAYLFIGTRGTGKTTCAKILAKAVNCEHPVNGNPCGECPSCRAIEEGSVMDIVEMDAASNNGVDNIRELREDAIFSPTNVKKRVYIVDEVHMLSLSAFNALLKILEEPPEHLMFILATTELNKVPATILSRCQRYSFKRISVPQIRDRLAYVASQESLQLEDNAAELIAQMADGGMRDALSLLDQCSGSAEISVDTVYSSMGLAGNTVTAQMMDHIIQQDSASSIALFHQMWQEGKDPSAMLNELTALMRDILIFKVAPKGGAGLLSGGFTKELLQRLSSSMTLAELTNRMGTIQDSLSAMRTSVNSRIDAELCLVRLCEPELSCGADSLTARIDNLEKKMETGIPVQTAPIFPVQSGPSVSSITAEQDPDPASPEITIPTEDVFMPDGSPIPEEPPVDELDLDDHPVTIRLTPVEVAAAPGPDSSEPEPIPAPPIPDKIPDPPVPAVEDPNSPGGSVDTEDPAFIDTLRSHLMDMLPSSKKNFIREPNTVFVLKSHILNLYISDTFQYNQLNHQEILNTIRQEAYKLAGREINVMMHNKTYDNGAQNVYKDLKDLSQFKEVNFTGGTNNG